MRKSCMDAIYNAKTHIILVKSHEVNISAKQGWHVAFVVSWQCLWNPLGVNNQPS